jgi:hypothetical protein
MQDLAKAFEDTGYIVEPEVLSEAQLRDADTQLDRLTVAGAGTRELLEEPWAQHLASQLRDCAPVRAIMGGASAAVQCTYFAKLPTRNWLVALHQDLSIPVLEKKADAPCTGWCEKEGTWFCQPPPDVLSQLVAVRVHLDDSTADNGPLRVVPGSHRHGRIASAKVKDQRRIRGEVTCTVPRRGILAMRPLLLHASSKALTDAPRRVLHFLFGAPALPWGLRWKHAF